MGCKIYLESNKGVSKTPFFFNKVVSTNETKLEIKFREEGLVVHF